MLTVFVTYHYFLGLKNLNVITKTARLVEKNYGVKLDLYNLPEDPEVYKNVFAKGFTYSVFQFESPGMRKMLKKFGPTMFSDLVLLVACYRPGPMQYLPNIIKRKHGRNDVEDSAVAHIPLIKDIVAPTYMAIVYQEQVQQIFRTLAGYSLGQADLVRRAMGHKKMDVLTAERNSFLYGDPERNIIGCQANRIDIDTANRLFDDMLDFAKYAFNKSHAAAYAVVAYITGWLKYHYPTEFYTSALEFTDVSKYPELIAEAKNFGVTVFGPDIERSKKGFSGKNKEIYFGFSGIKGIGDSIKAEQFSCSSMSEFILKTNMTKKVMETLVECGAFDRKVKNRQALLETLSDYYEQKDIIKKQLAEQEVCKSMIADLESGVPLDRKKYSITTKGLPDLKKLRSKLEAIDEKIQNAKEEIRDIVIPCEQVLNDIEKNLEREKELLGMYVSGHPLDPYGTPEDHGCVSIQNLEEPENSYDYNCLFGKVINLRKTITKKNREEMCFFQIMDQTGVIDACCFPQSYGLCGDQIHEGAVMKFRGQKKVKRNLEEEESFQFILVSKPNAAERVYDKKGKLLLAISGIDVWESTKIELMRYVAVSGHPLLVYDESTACTYTTDLRVSETLIQNSHFKSRLCD